MNRRRLRSSLFLALSLHGRRVKARNNSSVKWNELYICTQGHDASDPGTDTNTAKTRVQITGRMLKLQPFSRMNPLPSSISESWHAQVIYGGRLSDRLWSFISNRVCELDLSANLAINRVKQFADWPKPSYGLVFWPIAKTQTNGGDGS